MEKQLTKSQYVAKSEHDYSQIDEFGVPNDCPDAFKDVKFTPFYCDCIRAGWSEQQLTNYARDSHKLNITKHQFKKLIALIPSSEIIPETYRTSVLKNYDIQVEPLVEIQNIIAVQRMRVTNALAFESGLKKTDGEGTIPLKPTRDEMQFLYEMLKDFTNMQINLGLVARDNGGTANPVTDNHADNKIKEQASLIPPELRQQIADALRVKEEVIDAEVTTVTELSLSFDNLTIGEEVTLNVS